MTTGSNKNSQNDESNRFTETARALGPDEDEAAFQAKLAVITRHKLREKDVATDE